MLSGTRKPVSTKNAGMSVSRKSWANVVGSRAVQISRRNGSSCGILRDARDAEERVEDDQQRAEDDRRLDQAQDAADDLVGEAGLLEQRLRLVEALDDQRERDRRGDEDRQEADHVGVLRGELRPVRAEEVGHGFGEVRGEEEREEDRPDPEQAPDGALREAEDEEPHEVQDDEQVDRIDAAEGFPEIHQFASVINARDGAGAAQG